MWRRSTPGVKHYPTECFTSCASATLRHISVGRPSGEDEMTLGRVLEAARQLPPEERRRSAVRLLGESGAPAGAVGEEKLMAVMREAMDDGLFIADLTETMGDFRHADLDEKLA